MERAERIEAFTLIELLVSIAVAVIIAGVVYFSLSTALESWKYVKDQLALQKVLNEVAEEIADGTITSFGLKDSLEILQAGRSGIEFVPPWTDDTHSVTEPNFIYTLNSRIKPGTGVPIAEVRLLEPDEYSCVPIAVVKEGESVHSRVRLMQVVPRGRDLGFSYHPDAKTNPDVVKYIWWDSEDKEVFSEYKGNFSSISKNPFGIKITGMELRYYDKANNLITESEWVDKNNLNLITGIEFLIEASLGQYKKNGLSFVNLRNAPMQSGYFPLSEGMSIPIPDSYGIHALALKNINGVSNEDILQLKAVPESGKDWRIKIVFGKVGSAEPKIERYVVEYPPGHVVFTEYPKTGVGCGLNLLMLGSNGRYDYDYDGEDVEDIVVLEDDVLLEVERMDVEGAGLFVRP
ncbi:MAG: type II secretion system protein [Candidatus Omnitrophota bacterium]|nr:MAG: type II secretion system protein [Candidatus Omnitrophota bacterium]